MTERRVYDASLPFYASWSLESPIFTAVVFLQNFGNETRCIGSRHWKLKGLHTCLEDVAALEVENHWRIRTHITPPDPDRVYESQFIDQGLSVEEAPPIRDTVTLTRRLFTTLTIHTDGNEDLIEAINQYAPKADADNFIVTAGHKLDRYFVRALEVFAAWRHEGNGQPGDAWGDAPDYTLSDRARI